MSSNSGVSFIMSLVICFLYGVRRLTPDILMQNVVSVLFCRHSSHIYNVLFWLDVVSARGDVIAHYE